MKKQTTKSNEMGEDVPNIHINLRESSLQKKENQRDLVLTDLVREYPKPPFKRQF